MQKSTERYLLFKNEVIQERILILTLRIAHEYLNTPSDKPDFAKIQSKAMELINSPEGFKMRLAYSVVAMLDDGDLDIGVDDSDLEAVIIDVFDGMAGVTPVAPLP